MRMSCGPAETVQATESVRTATDAPNKLEQNRYLRESLQCAPIPCSWMALTIGCADSSSRRRSTSTPISSRRSVRPTRTWPTSLVRPSRPAMAQHAQSPAGAIELSLACAKAATADEARQGAYETALGTLAKANDLLDAAHSGRSSRPGEP
jgi:hypothetical protein